MNNALTRLYLRTRELLSSDRGATAVEYGLIVGLIAVVIIGAVTALGGYLNGWFTDINDCLDGASATSCN